VGLGVLGKDRHKPLPVRLETLMAHLSGLCNQTNLTAIFVPLDVNIFQGWSPLCAALTACVIVELSAPTSG